MEKELIIEEMPEPEPTEFEKTMANIDKMQDKWLEYYDENGNLCDKDGNIIDEVQPTPEESVKIDYNPVAESVMRTESVERYF